MKKEITILQNASNGLLEKLIRSSNGSFSSINDIYINDIYRGYSTIKTEKIKWFFPYQAELFSVDEKDGVVCFIAKCKISSSEYNLTVIIGGYVHYESISENELKLSYSDSYNTINILIYQDWLSDSDWLYYENRLNNQLKISNQNSLNDYLMEKIIGIEDLEELDLVDEELYIEKIKMLQKIETGGKIKDEEIPRVWGEYSLVSQITKQPVLMNKAMSVSLSKNEVQDLLNNLNERYKDRIKRFKSDGKISLIFSTSLRGHQSGSRNEIVLPKLGDWRFGYTDKYSAELIFHEFSHALDTPRSSSGSVKGKTDIHKHDFVYLLDMVLVDFSDFINERYIPINQREQILTNNEKLNLFYSKKDEIELELQKKEKIEIQEKKSKQNDIYSEIGLSENSFPLNVLLDEDLDRKIEYLKWSISKTSKDLNKSDLVVSKSIENKLNKEDYILNKQEIVLLNDILSKVSRNKFVYSLPMNEQLKASSYISKFQNEITELSKGRVDKYKIQDDVRIRTYEEASILKKTSGYTD